MKRLRTSKLFSPSMLWPRSDVADLIDITDLVVIIAPTTTNDAARADSS